MTASNIIEENIELPINVFIGLIFFKGKSSYLISFCGCIFWAILGKKFSYKTHVIHPFLLFLSFLIGFNAIPLKIFNIMMYNLYMIV